MTRIHRLEMLPPALVSAAFMIFAFGTSEDPPATSPSGPNAGPPSQQRDQQSHGGNESRTSDSRPQTRTEQTPTARVYSLDEGIGLGDFAYTVHKIETATIIGDPRMLGERAPAGAAFLIITYSIMNRGNESSTVLTDDFVVTSGNRRYSSSSNANIALVAETGQDWLVTELQPGIWVTTKTAFLIPETALDGDLYLEIPEKGFFSSGKAVVRLR